MIGAIKWFTACIYKIIVRCISRLGKMIGIKSAEALGE